MALKLLVALAAFSGAAAFAPSASMLPLSARRSVRASLAMRDSYMAGNWKLNPESLDDAKALAKEVVEASSDMPGEAAVFVPFPYLGAVGDVLDGSKVQLGAQDCYIEAKGAFTGAVSMGMLKSTGVKAVLAGHSERRSIFGEDDETINKKVLTIIESGLDCILCIGETQEEYDMNLNNEICALQLAKGLQGVSEEMLSKVIIAYEPVWAIGTGKVATPEIAESVHAYIRSWFTNAYSEKAADAMRIQYGGSVTPESVDELMAQPNIDGALVGGASLVGDKFARIVNYKELVPAAAAAAPVEETKAGKRSAIKQWWGKLVGSSA